MPPVAPPLSLYVHMPWCVKKCPYCDFNSHGVRTEPPYAHYVDALLADLDADLRDLDGAWQGRPIISVFFGGGTPSLFAPALIGRFLDGARMRLSFARTCEVTLEANPGTLEHGRFDGYLAAGVNRISFGIQSFDDAKLKRLGRVHTSAQAHDAVKSAQDAGIANLNLDLMYALPEQTLADAWEDIDRAVALQPLHISHYQLTLEPHTAFAAQPPPLPDEETTWAMQETCQARLAEAGLAPYEVSAYARPGRRCEHNLNYWRFGDYLGVGAGAHGKMTAARSGTVWRRWKIRHPHAYLKASGQPDRLGGHAAVPANELPFEYMLNALRLVHGVPMNDFAARTGVPIEQIAERLAAARRRGWLEDDPRRLRATPLGQRFLNDVIGSFLP